MQVDMEASIPRWFRELNPKGFFFLIDWRDNTGACSASGNFRTNIALGEYPVEGDPTRVMTHAFSQQLI